MDFAAQNLWAGTLARPYDYFIDTLDGAVAKCDFAKISLSKN